MNQLNAAKSELVVLYLGLKSDADIIREKVSPTMTGFWDRTYVRTVFAMFEGVAFATRQYILAQSAAGQYEVTIQESDLLSEQTFVLDGKGNIKVKENFLQFLPGFRLTMKVFGRSLGMADYVESAFGHHGFESFQDAVKVRNKVTHPKFAIEMMLTHQDIDAVKMAESWFNSLLAELLGVAFQTHSKVDA